MKRLKVPFSYLAASAAVTVGGAVYLIMPPAEYRTHALPQDKLGRSDYFVNADTAKRNSHHKVIHKEQHDQDEQAAVDHTLVEQVKAQLGEEFKYVKSVVKETAESLINESEDVSEDVIDNALSTQDAHSFSDKVHEVEAKVHHVQEQIVDQVHHVKDVVVGKVHQIENFVTHHDQTHSEVDSQVKKVRDHHEQADNITDQKVDNVTKVPEQEEQITTGKVSQLPKNQDYLETTYLLVGGGSAGYSAMRSILDLDNKADVLLVAGEDQLPYMRPPLSKELWSTHKDHKIEDLSFRDWGGQQHSVYYEDQSSYAEVGDKITTKPKILKGTKVASLNVDDNVATLDNGQKVKYVKLLLATGGTPKQLKQLQELKDSGKVTTFRNVQDLKNISAIVQKGNQKITIVGGGFLGSELSCAIARYGSNNGVKVTQLMPEDGNMGLIFPKYLVNWTTSRVRHEGVEVMPSTKVVGGELHGDQVILSLNNGKILEADHVIVCIGIVPNVELAKAAKLEIDDKNGGVVVNSQMEATKNVFAAGDVASFHDVTLGRRRIEHHDHAILSGRLAGRNMVGTKTSKAYKHQSMFWSDLGPEIGYEAVGILDAKLKTVGLWAKSSPEDTPAKAVEDDPSNIRSGQPEKLKSADPWTVANDTEDEVNTNEPEAIEVESKQEDQVGNEDHYGKGVVFYVNSDEKIVGVLLWNMFNRTNIARRIIADGKKVEDIKTLASLFQIHDD